MGQNVNRVGMFEMPQDPELADLFRVALRSLQLQMRTHSVGQVVSYNPSTQRANVTVDILQVIRDNSTSPSDSDANPTVSCVPRPVPMPGRSCSGIEGSPDFRRVS